MKKFFRLHINVIWAFVLLSISQACDTEDASDCLQTVGRMTSKEVTVEPFHELIVYKGIKLFIEQGPEHKVIIESGENLIGEISAEVENGRLSLRNGNGCNLFREYNVTSIYVTVPDLTWLQNAGNNIIEGRGELHFPEIWLRSYNQEKDPEIYTIGDFRLNLVSERIRITSDNYSHFFLTGRVDFFDVYIADGDSRLEGRDLIAETVQIQHRGTNNLIVNPQQVLKGEIRSTGDVISVNQPSVVDVDSFYTGKLIFE